MKFSDETVREAVSLVDRGATWKEGAESIGMSHLHLRKRAARLGIGPRRTVHVSYAPQRIRMPDSVAELAYLAGIFDGEGSITIAKSPRRAVRVSIINTDTVLLEWLQEFGGKIVEKNRNQSLGKQRCFEWRVYSRRDILALLTAIEPYMKIKREKAREAIAALHDWIGVGEKERAWLGSPEELAAL